MIIALVQFRLPAPMTVAQAREVFASTAPRYRDLPGLLIHFQSWAISGRIHVEI